jgi:hypothetical protein
MSRNPWPKPMRPNHRLASTFYHDEQDNVPPRDTPLSFNWRALNQDWIKDLGLTPAPSARHERARASIAAEADKHARLQPDGWISYPRRACFYTDQQRYRGTDYTFATVPWAVDNLASQGLLEHDRAPPGRFGFQSRFKASTALVDAVKVPLVTVYDPLETIRMKDANKRLIEYPNTEFTCSARRRLAEINEAVRSVHIGFAHGPNNLVALGEGVYVFTQDERRCCFDLRQDQYHRVFNNMRWTQGGRLYGPAPQSIPKAIRRHITIDGEPTAEPDYPTLHARLLYAKVVKPLDGDAYGLVGFERPLVKLAFNIMLNADTDRKALAAIAKKIGGDGAFPKAKALMETIKRRHAPVAQFFCTGAGLWLQRSDANMAEGVMLNALRDGIVVLGVHDSFIVQERYEGKIREIMQEQFEREIRRLNPEAASYGYVRNVPHMEVITPSSSSLPSPVHLN